MKNSQSPSIYSIYHNALPYYLDRADICTIDEEEEAFAVGWLQYLLKGNLTVQVNGSSLSFDKLRHLYFESKNLEKTHGAKTFGFGYPFIIDTHESELIVAPLFTWLLSIEPAQTKVDAWIIRFGEDQHILPNYRILRHLKEKYDLDWVAKAEDLAFGHKLNRSSLFALCDELANRLHFEHQHPPGDVMNSPGIDEIGAYSQNGAVHWSGVIGLFPPQHTKWRPGKLKPEDILSPSEQESPEDRFLFPYLPVNPQQASAMETAALNNISIIEGVNATARAETVVNLILNALVNVQKCLVVSERTPALKYTQNLLSKTGLNQLHFLLDDSLNDKLPMLELLRVAADGTSRTITHSEEDFLFKKNKYIREKAKLDAAYQAVKNKVFGAYNWTETVGLFLASNRVEGKELLASQLNGQDFEYTIDEYEVFKQGILSCQPLFQRIKTLSHPLSNLHDNVFKNTSADDGYRFVKQQLKTYSNKAAQLQHRYITKVDAYAARLKEHYEQHYELLAGETRGLQEKISGFGDSFGEDFRQAGAGSFRLSSLFSSKKKKVRKAQEEVARDYKALLRHYAGRQYFDFQFAPAKEGMHIAKTASNLGEFSSALKQWFNKIDALVQEEVMRLNGKTVHPDLDYKEQITGLEYALDVLLEELNESQLYQKALENKTLTIPQRQKYLESIIEQLETTQLNLRDFEIFYQWQAQWLNLDVLGQKVIRALVKVKPEDWMAAFESWYFNNLLLKEQKPGLPADESLIENHEETWHALKPLVLNRILSLWQKKQIAGLKALKKKSKKSYQLVFEKQGHAQAANIPLASIFEESFDAVSSFLPVLFVTPHVALNVLPASNAWFDYIIFDEANRFSVEAATAIVPHGKKTVICGSNDSYGSETSLLQYALENGVPATALTNRYDWHSIETTDDAATMLHPNFGLLQVENVEGRFHELEGTNDVEAQYIIRLLNQIKQTPQRIYPSVGIVTLTVEQRDIIANYLLKLKQQNAHGAEKIQQLERNGMSVFHVDELFGQHFDILIVSCTFGMVNLKGAMSKKIVFINTPEGVSRIRMLIDQTVQKTFLVHSLPDDQLDKFIAKRLDKGTWLLAHYIRLAEAVANGNKEMVRVSLEALGKTRPGKSPKSIFAHEVGNALRPYIEEKRLTKNLQLDGLCIPLSVKPAHKEEPPVVLHPDGFFADTPFTFSLWESTQRKKIAATGLVYLPVWSANWLKNPTHEARLLASKIIKQDSRYKESKKEAEESEKEFEDK